MLAQGVVCQGPNQFAVKGKVVDAAGVATTLRLTVSLPGQALGMAECLPSSVGSAHLLSTYL